VPRSQLDYLAIAQRFDTVFLSEVLPLSSDCIVLFMRLIDVLYDQGIRLLILAEVPLEQLYTALEYADVFQRTYSRLSEMLSQEYWQKHAKTTFGAEEA
jgi:cell division protein ZapE